MTTEIFSKWTLSYIFHKPGRADSFLMWKLTTDVSSLIHLKQNMQRPWYCVPRRLKMATIPRHTIYAHVSWFWVGSLTILMNRIQWETPWAFYHGPFLGTLCFWIPVTMLQEAKPHKGDTSVDSPSWALHSPEMIPALIASHLKSNHFEPPT